MDRPTHPQRTGARGGEGGESVREVVGVERGKKKDGTAEGGTPSQFKIEDDSYARQETVH